MVALKDITGLVSIGAGLFIFIKAYPLIRGLVGGLGGLGGLGGGGGQPLPLTAEQTRDIFATELGGLEALRADVARETADQIAAASVREGTNIGVGQQDYAVLDANAQIAAFLASLANGGITNLGIGDTPPATPPGGTPPPAIETYTAPVSGYGVPTPYQPQALPPVAQLQQETYTIDRPVQTVVARPHTAPGQTATFNAATQTWTVN